MVWLGLLRFFVVVPGGAEEGEGGGLVSFGEVLGLGAGVGQCHFSCLPGDCVCGELDVVVG